MNNSIFIVNNFINLLLINLFNDYYFCTENKKVNFKVI